MLNTAAALAGLGKAGGVDEPIPTLGRILTGVSTWEMETWKSHLFQLMPKQEPETGSKVP